MREVKFTALTDEQFERAFGFGRFAWKLWLPSVSMLIGMIGGQLIWHFVVLP